MRESERVERDEDIPQSCSVSPETCVRQGNETYGVSSRRFSLELKPGDREASKFHRQWEEPYELLGRVANVTYRVKKVRGYSRKSRVVHLNILRLDRRRQKGSTEEMGAKEAVDAPQGGKGTGEQIQTTLEEVVSMEPDTATIGTEEEVVSAAAESEGYNEVVDMPDESTSKVPPFLADSASDREVEQGARYQVVDIPADAGKWTVR